MAAQEELKTVTYATPPMEERRKKERKEYNFCSHCWLQYFQSLITAYSEFPITLYGYMSYIQYFVCQKSTQLSNMYSYSPIHCDEYRMMTHGNFDLILASSSTMITLNSSPTVQQSVAATQCYERKPRTDIKIYTKKKEEPQAEEKQDSCRPTTSCVCRIKKETCLNTYT